MSLSRWGIPPPKPPARQKITKLSKKLQKNQNRQLGTHRSDANHPQSGRDCGPLWVFRFSIRSLSSSHSWTGVGEVLTTGPATFFLPPHPSNIQYALLFAFSLSFLAYLAFSYFAFLSFFIFLLSFLLSLHFSSLLFFFPFFLFSLSSFCL